MNNEIAEFAVNILKQYAKEKGTMVRGTTDLSPLEMWLITKLFELKMTKENTMPKYRKKPIEVEAVQWKGNNYDEINSFFGSRKFIGAENHSVVIRTLEGRMLANVNDWIIKGVKGEFYPCKPDIFEQTYERVK